jgi:hypothetical protein
MFPSNAAAMLERGHRWLSIFSLQWLTHIKENPVRLPDFEVIIGGGSHAQQRTTETANLGSDKIGGVMVDQGNRPVPRRGYREHPKMARGIEGAWDV